MTPQETERYYQDNASARLIALIVVAVSSFLTPLSLSGSMVAVPAIAEDLHADAVYASWIPAAFLLSNLLCMLPSGRLADLYGRKRIFLIGSGIFALGSLIAGFAPSIEVLLASRIIQGMGSAFFFSTGIAIIGAVYQHHGRGAALGWLVSAIYLGMTGGPFIGGWLTQHFGWHISFLFIVPIVLMVLAVAAFNIKGEWRSAEPQKMDWLGTLYSVLAIGGLFMAVSLLPAWTALLWLMLGVVFTYVFFRHCARVKNPLLRAKVVLQNKPLSRALGASMMLYASNYGVLFLLTLYFQYNRGMSPTAAGQMIMVQALVMTVLAPLAGKLSDRYRPRLLATVGCLAMVAGLMVLLPTISPTTPLWILIICLIAFGIGFGLFSTPNSNGVLGSVPPAQMGMVSALLNLSRLLGQMLGTAVVTLLMSLSIGKVKITPDQYDTLMIVVRSMVGMALVFAIVAAYFSKERQSDKPA